MGVRPDIRGAWTSTPAVVTSPLPVPADAVSAISTPTASASYRTGSSALSAANRAETGRSAVPAERV
jgi:hypothetical protein